MLDFIKSFTVVCKCTQYARGGGGYGYLDLLWCYI